MPSDSGDTARAMSQENVEKIKAMLGPFGDVDVAGIDWEAEAIREVLERDYSPDVELTTLESGVGIGPSGSYQGRDGVVRYFKEWFEPFSEYRMKWLDYIDAGQRVLVPMEACAVGSASGAPVELELVLSYELQDGVITRLDEYDTVEQALEAAALRE
jgi:ketosteroid isomerase-like protein